MFKKGNHLKVNPAVFKHLPDQSVCIDFWNSFSEWFAERGYALYQRQPKTGNGCVYPTTDTALPFQEAEFPYPFLDLPKGEDAWQPGMQFPGYLSSFSGNVFYAQDSEMRHVVIKLMSNTSDELRILCLLYEDPSMKNADTFPSLIPVLELLPFEKYCFVVMPRWGTQFEIDGPLQGFVHVYEVFDFIHSMLKALTFLHRHRIFHHDIAHRNILVNHFGNMRNLYAGRTTLRGDKRLRYALFDFSESIIFPLGTVLEECRLPAKHSWTVNTDNQPPDTRHGEPDFNPFVMDVGAMGVVFCKHFKESVPNAPMLAPLFDRMVTWETKKRFTALEALHFFEQKVMPLTTEQQLHDWTINPQPKMNPMHSINWDKWALLAPEFVAEWAEYRTASPPLSYLELQWPSDGSAVSYTFLHTFRRLFPSLSMWGSKF